MIRRMVFATFLVVATVLGTLGVVSVRNSGQEVLAQVTTMPVYTIELLSITKNLDGSVNVNFVQKVNGVEDGNGGIIYGSLAVLREEIGALHGHLLNSNIAPLILAARAQAIHPNFDNINPLLNKTLTIDPNSVQVVRFQ